MTSVRYFLRRYKIIRRPTTSLLPTRKGPKVNRNISASTVQLIGEDGINRGNMPIEEALSLAETSGLDLIEISPNVEPPVCKLLDHGKYKYQVQKKASETRKKQKIVEVKEIKVRPNISQHDYDVKIRSIHRFIEDGDKVKVTLRFRGREMAHQELGMSLLKKIRDECLGVTKAELDPRLEGRQIIMILAPR